MTQNNFNRTRNNDQADHSNYWGEWSRVGCEHKTWQRFRLYQRQIKPGKYIRTLSHGEVIISQQLFDEQDQLDMALEVKVGGNYPAGEFAEVRNFYFQRLATCSDPCDGKVDCTTFINGCGFSSANTNYHAGHFLVSKKMKISYELKCDRSLTTERYIMQLIERGGFHLYDVKYYQSHKYLTIYHDITDDSGGLAINHLNCADGEWEKMVMEIRAKEDEFVVTFLQNGILKLGFQFI